MRIVDSIEYGAYTDLKLTFADTASNPQTLPKNTTIILVDRSNNGKTYWHYRAGDRVSSVSMKDFQKMGESGTSYNIPTPAAENSYVDRIIFGAQAPDSYCLMLTVKERDSISIVMEVPYYFVIKPAQ